MFLNVGRLLNLALGGVKRVFVLFQHLLQPLWQGRAQLAGVLEDRAELPFTLEEIVTRTNLEELVTLKVYVRVPLFFQTLWYQRFSRFTAQLRDPFILPIEPFFRYLCLDISVISLKSFSYRAKSFTNCVKVSGLVQ